MNYKEKYNKWTTDIYFDEKTKQELLTIEEDEKEIKDRFYKELSFGTGGLRGVMGAGTNRINSYTIKKATLGLANYVKANNRNNPKVVIAYDTRNNSKKFTEDAALVLSSLGIKTYLFDAPMATPVLSYAVRHLQCDAGIVITASHNPKEYNGYKVYDKNGGQLIPEEAKEVTSYISQIENYAFLSEIKENIEIIETLDSELLGSFIEEVNKQSIFKGDLNVVYTPLHGAGWIPVKEVLKDFNVSIVKEQELPDGNFNTVVSPNPEDRDALKMAIEQAEKKDADIVIGTDPDCDRIGVAVKHNGAFALLTGNQIGALLMDFVLKNQEISAKSTLIKTIVTNDLGANIAVKNGMKVLETLTGFKYIGAKINEFEQNPESKYEFLIGYEESYGYLVGTHARDKDGVVASLMICEMTALYKSKGITLLDKLETIYKEYGYYLDELDSITLKGIHGADRIQSIMAETRKLSYNFFTNVVEFKDYLTGVDGLPKEDVLKFILDDESWIAVRPSGTEPKIKFYYSIKADNREKAQKKITKIKEQIQKKINIKL